MMRLLRSFSCILIFVCFVASVGVVSLAQTPNTKFVLPGDEDESKGLVLPLEYDPMRYPVPMLHLSINGSAPLLFMVDTGVSFPVLLDSWLVQELKLPPINMTTHIDGGGDAHYVQVNSFQAKTLSGEIINLQCPEFAQLDMTFLHSAFPGEKIAGIVGAPFFSKGAARFDFVQSTMTLFITPHRRTPDPHALVLPLIIDPNDSNYFYVSLKLSGKEPIKMYLDTGAETCSMPAAKLPSALHVTATAQAEYFSVEGRRIEINALTSNLTLAGFDIPNVVWREETNPRKPPTLGMNLLNRFIVTLDVPNKQLVLEPSPGLTRYSSLPALRLMKLIQSKAGFLVAELISDSAAEKAGVHKGDFLVALNGKPTAALPLSAVQHLLDGYADAQAELTLTRLGTPQPLIMRYQRPRLYLPPPLVRVGIGLGAAYDRSGKFVVQEVVSGSSAAEANVVVGDEIIEVEGQQVNTLTPQQIADRLHKPEGATLILKIVHAGEDKPREVKLKVRKMP